MIGKDKEIESLLSELQIEVSNRDEVGMSPKRQEMGHSLDIELP